MFVGVLKLFSVARLVSGEWNVCKSYKLCKLRYFFSLFNYISIEEIFTRISFLQNYMGFDTTSMRLIKTD